MIETLDEMALTGECDGRAWWAGYVCPHRYATTAIELEASPGRWVVVPNFELMSWDTEADMLAAIEFRVRGHVRSLS